MKHYRQLIAAMLFCTILISCAGQSGETDTTSGTEDTSETDTGTTVSSIPEPDIPELDYGGAEFTYLIRDGNVSSYMEKYVYAEEENGEPVNDAIYKRNRQVEEKFNIKIKALYPAWESGWAGELEKLARGYIQSGDDGIDVISSMRSTLSGLAREGGLYNMLDLDYADLTADWWDKNAADELTIEGRLYLMPSDISMGNLAMARFMYFNQGITDEYGLEEPYQLVENNKWTIDKVLEMTAAVSEDLNGDSVFDHNDRYGMLTDDSQNGTFVYLVAGTGVSLAVKDTENVIIPNIMTEKVQDMITKCSAVLTGTDCAISSEELFGMGDTTGYANEYDYPRALFADGHFLFYQSGIASMECFRDMKQDFGLVPNPKYDENQENYHHKIDLFALIFAVPVCAGDMERVGAVLEYSAWLSHQTLLPAYYETTVKGKRLRDDKAIEMLDVIKSSMLYDLSDVFGLGGNQILWDAFKSGNLSSTYAKKEKTFRKQIDKLLDDLSSIG